MLHVLEGNKKLKCSQIKNCDVNNVKVVCVIINRQCVRDTTWKMAYYLHSILKSTCEQIRIFTKLKFIINSIA